MLFVALVHTSSLRRWRGGKKIKQKYRTKTNPLLRSSPAHVQYFMYTSYDIFRSTAYPHGHILVSGPYEQYIIIQLYSLVLHSKTTSSHHQLLVLFA